MRRLLIAFMLVLLSCSPLYAGSAITDTLIGTPSWQDHNDSTTIDADTVDGEHASAFADAGDGMTAANITALPLVTADSADTGLLVDATDGAIKSFSISDVLGGGGVTNLDEAYDGGPAITVDAGAVTMTATDAANNVALTVNQDDTGTARALTITNDGSGDSLNIDHNGNGTAIEIVSDSTNERLLHLDHNSSTSGNAMVIDTEVVSGSGILFSGPMPMETGTGLVMDAFDNLTTGSIASFESDSNDTVSANNLVQIINENASNTTSTNLFTRQDGTGNSLWIDHNANSQAVNIDYDGTSSAAINIDANLLQGGDGIKISSSGGGTFTGDLIELETTNAAAANIGLRITNDGADAKGISINDSSTTGRGIQIQSNSKTEGDALRIWKDDAGSELTTGQLIQAYSNDTNATAGQLVKFDNRATSGGKTVLDLDQNSPNAHLSLTGSVTANANITEGDLWYNATANELNFYDGVDTTDLLGAGATSLQLAYDGGQSISMSANSPITVTSTDVDDTMLTIRNDSITSGKMLHIVSEATNNTSRSLLEVSNLSGTANNAAPLIVNQAAPQNAIDVHMSGNSDGINVDMTGSATSGRGLDVQATTTSTGQGIRVLANALTTGTGLLIDTTSVGSHMRFDGAASNTTLTEGELWYNGSDELNFRDATSTTNLLAGGPVTTGPGWNMVQMSRAQSNAEQASLSPNITWDDNPPTWAEGVLLSNYTINHTAVTSGNLLEIEAQIQYNGGGSYFTGLALFIDGSGTDPAVCTQTQWVSSDWATSTLHLHYMATVADTSSHQYAIRLISRGAGSSHFINRSAQSSPGDFGATTQSFMKITEWDIP